MQGRGVTQPPPAALSSCKWSCHTFPGQSITNRAGGEGRGSKSALPSLGVPILPWIAAFVLLLSGCYKHRVGHGKILLSRPQALTFPHSAGPWELPALIAGLGAEPAAKEGARISGRCTKEREEVEPPTPLRPWGSEMDAGSAGWPREAGTGCRLAGGGRLLSSTERVHQCICGVGQPFPSRCREQGNGSLSPQPGPCLSSCLC